MPSYKGFVSKYMTGASETLTPDSSIAEGDSMLLLVNQLSSAPAPATPLGWTLLSSAVFNSRVGYIYGKLRVAGESGYPVTRSAASAATIALLWVGSGSPISNWITGVGKLRNTAPAETVTVTAPSVATTVAGSLAIGIMFEATSAAEATVPTLSGGTQRFFVAQLGSGNIETIMVGTNLVTNPGASGIIPPSMVLAPTPLAGQYSDGTERIPGAYKWWDGAALLDLERVVPVWPGRKVHDLFAGGIAKVAHRGGSLNNKDMSMRAYTQAAIAGCTAMEFSVGRTSDKKYFGLHDATMNRTTPSLTANYLPGDHTWAEISQLMQTAPATNDSRFGDQPYELLSMVLEKYAETHTFFVDPKVIGAQYWDEFLAYLLTFPDAQNTFVIKYFHTATVLADKARALGFTSWGYGYQTDVNGSNGIQLATTASHWDYLGMDYQADDAAWAETRRIAAANGNLPIIGHICPSLSTAQRCISQGAIGVMCSGIKEVISLG